MERFAPAEQKATADQLQPPAKERADREKQAPPQRQPAIEAKDAAAADGPCAQGAKPDSDGGGVGQRVGVDEAEHLAPRLPPAGVARGGDVAIVDRDDASAVLGGDVGRAIGRGIIDNENLERFADFPGGGVQGGQSAAEVLLLVVGGDDERDHGGLRMVNTLNRRNRER